MNIYLFAWHLPKEMHETAVGAIQRTTSIYPQLDPATFWSRSSGDGQIFVATIQTPRAITAPRKYIDTQGDVAVFYSGLPINVTDKYLGHDAGDLMSHWEDLATDLEGQYAVFRCDFSACKADLLTDRFGIEPSFYYRKDKLWIISNSLWLINQCVKTRPSLDPLGMALLLSLRFPSSDRTLLSHARFVPAASHWKWESTDSEPNQSTYLPRNFVAEGKRQSSLRPRDIRDLADQMARPLVLLAKNFGALDVQLTGGLDSRLVTGLMMRAGLSSRYQTFSHINPIDNYIAKRIAETYNLDHRFLSVRPERVLRTWSKAWWYLLRQGDGMAGFDEIPYPDTLRLLEPCNQLDTRIWGSGGGIAKGLCQYLFKSKHPTPQDVLSVLKKAYFKTRTNPLIRPQCVSQTDAYLSDYVDGCIAQDISPIDIPEVFYLYERVGRWPGITARVAMPLGSLYSPFTTRAFIEAVFHLTPRLRAKRLLHYELIRFCAPSLHKIPYDDPKKFKNFKDISWNIWLQRLNKYFGVGERTPLRTSAFELQPLAYIEIKLDFLRDLCLSNTSSDLWELVDRAVFEKITGDQTSPAERAPYLSFLNTLSTICSYVDLLEI